MSKKCDSNNKYYLYITFSTFFLSANNYSK